MTCKLTQIDTWLFKTSYDLPQINCMKLLSEANIFVYRMGRLCGGVHEISGIKAPILLHGWVGGDGVGGGGVGGGGVDGWVGGGSGGVGSGRVGVVGRVAVGWGMVGWVVVWGVVGWGWWGGWWWGRGWWDG